MTADLRHELSELDPALLSELEDHGFVPGQLLRWSQMLAAGPDQNRVTGQVTLPEERDVTPMPRPGDPGAAELEAAGRAALQRGELALVVLAGGMATRMGGVVKALVEAAHGRTFLDLRLAEREYWSREADAQLPLWMLTSHATDVPIRRALGERLDGDSVDVFRQYLSLRLTPDGHLFREADGQVSPHATGHGDLIDAMLDHGRLRRFVRGGGRYLWLANLDNLGATVDPLLLGWHIKHADPLSVEVVDKVGSDRGGIPVRWNGRPVILENFRLPHGFDEDTVPVFNTNTFIVDAEALLALDFDWTYFLVQKTVDERPAIQFERLVGELTSALGSRMVRVPRDGDASRFLPVKDTDELERRRAEIARRTAVFLR